MSPKSITDDDIAMVRCFFFIMLLINEFFKKHFSAFPCVKSTEMKHVCCFPSYDIALAISRKLGVPRTACVLHPGVQNQKDKQTNSKLLPSSARQWWPRIPHSSGTPVYHPWGPRFSNTILEPTCEHKKGMKCLCVIFFMSKFSHPDWLKTFNSECVPLARVRRARSSQSPSACKLMMTATAQDFWRQLIAQQPAPNACGSTMFQRCPSWVRRTSKRQRCPTWSLVWGNLYKKYDQMIFSQIANWSNPQSWIWTSV